MPGVYPLDIDALLQTGVTGANNPRSKLPANLSDEERRASEQADFFWNHGAYAHMMQARPETLIALADSPVGLASFMIDHDVASMNLISEVFALQPRASAGTVKPRV